MVEVHILQKVVYAQQDIYVKFAGPSARGVLDHQIVLDFEEC